MAQVNREQFREQYVDELFGMVVDALVKPDELQGKQLAMRLRQRRQRIAAMVDQMFDTLTADPVPPVLANLNGRKT